MADDFTRNQFRWLDQIAADPAVTAAGFLLAYRIAKYVNRDSGDAWPSQPLLAAEVRLSVRTVRDLSDQLESAGHLTVTASRGRGNSCRYRPILRAVPDQSEPEPEFVEEPPVNRSEDMTDPEEGTRGGLFERAAGSPPPVRAKQDGFAADFEAWWLQYPKKVSKGAALAAYSRARKGGAIAADLEVGAMRYSAARLGEDPKFTKHGATWLNQKCWLDEPEPPRSAGFNGRPSSGFQRAAPLSHLEIALAGLARDE